MGTPTLNADVPANLPVATPEVATPITQTNYQGTPAETQAVSDDQSDTALGVADTDATETLTELENHAHQNHVLLSSDAMRYLAGRVDAAEQLSLLDKVIGAAKAQFPSDDGWVVVNLSRMEQVLADVTHEPLATVLAAAPAAPMQAGSLAEAIVMGNVAAA